VSRERCSTSLSSATNRRSSRKPIRLGVRYRLPRIIHASEQVEMAESAAASVRKKRDSSISVSARLQKDHETDALVSAGNTGAVVAAALFEMGRIESIQRPAIATVLPTPQGNVVVLDVGATSDPKPIHLYQFALMGSIYARLVLHVERPRVGLLNIGEEAEKGSELYYEAHQLLKRSPVHFVGNVEGRDIILGTADVVVCDGFVGNVLLKFAESVIPSISGMIKDEIQRHPLSMMAGTPLEASVPPSPPAPRLLRGGRRAAPRRRWNLHHRPRPLERPRDQERDPRGRALRRGRCGRVHPRRAPAARSGGRLITPRRDVHIVGTGSCVPDRVLTNQDLEQIVDTSDEWITSRTGIKERRISDPATPSSVLATKAAERALEMAGLKGSDLDQIVVGR
jgi:hypothetical protein